MEGTGGTQPKGNKEQILRAESWSSLSSEEKSSAASASCILTGKAWRELMAPFRKARSEAQGIKVGRG